MTLLDFPGKVAATVFTAGCGFRCRFCHNPEFVLPERLAEMKNDFIPEAPFFRFLETRKGLLDGVVVCGGEPTMHPDLPDFIRKIKGMGFSVKLDTNGNRPEVVRGLVEEGLVDYFAVDFKQTPEKYGKLCGDKPAPEKILETVRIVVESGVDHEFRTTVAKGEHSAEDVRNIASLLKGARRYCLQNFRPAVTLDPEFR